MRHALLLLSLACVTGCADLPAIEHGTCGNGVVDANEDCDTFTSSSHAGETSCGAPGQVSACRFVCGGQVDGAPVAPFCPDGYGCGIDKVCRAPSGRFEVTQDPVPAPAARVLLGDFDGDGAEDVLAVGNIDALGRAPARILYFGPEGANEATFAVPASVTSPSIGDVTDDGIADLAFGFLPGIGVAVGQPDRSVIPLAYPTLSLPATSGLRFSTLRGLSPELGRQVVLFTEILGSPQLARLGPTSNPLPMASLDGHVAELSGDAAVGRIFDETSECDDLAYAFTGHADAFVFPVCVPGAGGDAWNDMVSAPIRITLGSAADPTPPAVDQPVRLADVNADGHLDVLVGAGKKTYVAYGDGKGTFYPSAKLDGSPNRASQLVLPAVGTNGDFPLDVGDLDGDGKVDLVLSTGIWTTKKAKIGGVLPWGPVYLRAGSGEWAGARIVDMNRDGLPDVVAYVKDALALDFLGGNGDGFNLLAIPTDGSVSNLAVGDLDGDLVEDVAFAEQGLHEEDGVTTGLGDSLTVLYGAAGAYPETLARLGRLGRIQEVGTGHLASNPFTTPGSLDDLGVLSLSEDQSSVQVAILYGSSEREPLAPFGVNDTMIQVTTHVNAVGMGRFAQPASPMRRGVWSFAAVTSDVGAEQTKRLWLVRASDDASVTAATHTDAIMLDAPLAGAGVPRVLAADLDGDGVDEAVVVAATSDDTTATLLVARSASDAAGTWSFSVASQSALAVGGKRWDAQMGDVDGDGHPDLVLYRGASRDVLVCFGDGHGGVDVDHPVTLTSPDEAFAGAGLVRATTGSGSTVAMVTRSSVYLATAASSSPRTLTPARVADVGGTGVQGGDVNGDGVEDLLLCNDNLGKSSVRVVLGAPVRK